jgi:tRNA(Ile)-lysidine synthase
VRSFAGGRLVRPLLPFSKEQLRAYAVAKGVRWYEDATNQDLTISRNRYRYQLLPALEKENPRLLQHLTSYHQQLAALLAWQNQEVQAQLARVAEGNQLHLTSWEELPEVAQRLVLQHWLEQRLPAIKQQLVDELMAGLKNHVAPQQSWALPNGYQLVKDYQSCRLVPTQKNHGKGQNGLSTVVELGQWYRVSDQRAIRVIAAKDDTVGQSSGQEMWLAPDQLPLRLRLWRAGDALRLKQGGHQLARRILIDQKVPNAARQAQVVLVDAHDEPVWLVGRKWAWFTRPADYRQRWRHVLISMKEV